MSQGNLAILPPDPEGAAARLKAVIEDSFKGADLNVKKALYIIAVANFNDFDMFASQYSQIVGKLPKVDLAELSQNIDEYPYEDVEADTKPIKEILAERRIKGNKEITTLAAIVYEMGGNIVDVGKDENGRRIAWFRATVPYEGVDYIGEAKTKQLAAKAVFDENAPIRHIPRHRSFEEPSEVDTVNKQKANLYMQKHGYVAIVTARQEDSGAWRADGRLSDVTASITGQDGQKAARKKCLYALFNFYKTKHNVPDSDYGFISGEAGAPGDDMEE